MRLTTIAIFGGSFDPIHQGHLQIAADIQSQWGFDHFMFLPCGQPALKAAYSSTPANRLAMLKLALAPYPEFEINELELWQQQQSYTIDTLIQLRAKLGKSASLSFILGEDAMAQLMLWKRWEELLNYSHLIYHQRPILVTPFSSTLQVYIAAHLSKDPSQIKTQNAGLIYSQTAKDYPYSSTQIRQQLQRQEPTPGLAPQVLSFIQQHHLYQKN